MVSPRDVNPQIEEDSVGGDEAPGTRINQNNAAAPPNPGAS